MKNKSKIGREDPDLPWYSIFLIYFVLGMQIVFSYIVEFFDIITGRQAKLFQVKKGYPPLLRAWDSFYTRRLYHRLSDCWNRPVNGYPGSWIMLKERETRDYCESFNYSGKDVECLNLGSYNYLGFSDNKGRCLEEVQESIKEYGISTCSFPDNGTMFLHRDVEEKTARFLNKEDCIIFSMGYQTNASCIPSLVGPGCLIMSDSLNHASLVNGCRSSGAKIKVFAHNDADDLEKILINSIAEGQPKTHKPWKKILIIVEGIYSMEGEICNLPEIVRIKNKYKCYLWMDEAHSIGAMGPTGRGVCEHYGIDTSEVDLLMGTYTKSFASVGGYIASSKEVIDHIRRQTYSIYDTNMPPGCCQQILTSMSIIMGEDGTNEGQTRIKNLRENSNYFRKKLMEKGLRILGDHDSPIIPLMLYHNAKIVAFSREALKRNIAVVVVGYPATPLLMGRSRFCISASHTKEDMDWAVKEIDEIADILMVKYEK